MITRNTRNWIGVEMLEGRRLLSTTYYVSPAGDDANSGTSTGSPWKSIARVNDVSFDAGDKVLFKGSSSFAGSLQFTADDDGTSSAPIVVGSYGSGRATIRSGDADGVLVWNTAGIEVRGLKFVGSGATENDANGINVYNDLDGDVKLDHVYVNYVDVSGYGGWGIKLGGWNGRSAFSNIRLTHSTLHDNGYGGLTTYAQGGKWNEHVYVGGVSAYNNLGRADVTSIHTGNGIVLANVNGATIERSVAHDNGKLNAWTKGGPVGIWAYESNHVTIQRNESYHNQTGTGKDGGGFDFDGGVTNSVMQYNYSHDNEGAGYLLYKYSGASAWSSNVVRYNISQDDGRRNGYPGIYIGSGVSNAEVYNNVVFMSRPASGAPTALRFNAGANVRVRNNVFATTGGLRVVAGASGTGRVLQGNDYWSDGDAILIAWDGTTYRSLDGWRDATGQEMHGGLPTGLSVDPGYAALGNGGTIGDAYDLETELDAYRLTSRSPLIDAGLDLETLFSVDNGGRDFYRVVFPLGAAYDIGASEYQVP